MSCSRQYRIADVLPLTPLQQGLLFHTGSRTRQRRSVRRAAGYHGRPASSIPQRLRDAVHNVVNRHPNLVARFNEEFGEPVQVIPADPEIRLAVRRIRRRRRRRESMSSSCAPPNGRRCATWPTQPVFRAALIRIAEDRHRLVLTIHHIVIDGWSLPVLLQEIFAGYFGQRLPAPRPIAAS